MLGAALLAGGATAQERVVVAGTVVDAAGRAARDATVCLSWCNHPELPRLLAAALGDPALAQVTVTTDAEGAFRCAAPDAAPFALYAQRGAEMSRVHERVLPGDFVRLELAAPRSLAGEAITPHAEVELRLLPAMARDPSLAHLDLATVMPAPTLRARADARGRFELAAPPHRDLELRVRHEGTLFSFRAPADIAFPDPIAAPLRFACGGVDPCTVRVIDTSDPGRELALDESGAVRRAIWSLAPVLAVSPERLPGVFEPMLSRGPTPLQRGCRLRAQLRERTGAQLGGARLVFARPIPRQKGFGGPARRAPWIAWTARTDREGRIDVRWLEPGVPIVAWVEVDGRFVCFLCEVPQDDLDLGAVELAGDGAIGGRVTTHELAPAAGAWVFVQPELPRADGGPAARYDDLALSRVLMTDRAGRFRAEGLSRGNHRLVVRAPGLCVTSLTAAATSGAAPVDVRLPPAFVVRGVVHDVNGDPVAGARVHLTPGSPEATPPGELPSGWETRSAADGTFTFLDVPPHALVLHAFVGQRRQIRHAQAGDVPIDGTVVELRLPAR